MLSVKMNTILTCVINYLLPHDHDDCNLNTTHLLINIKKLTEWIHSNEYHEIWNTLPTLQNFLKKFICVWLLCMISMVTTYVFSIVVPTLNNGFHGNLCH